MQLHITLIMLLLGISLSLSAQTTQFNTLSNADAQWVDNYINNLVDNNKIDLASVGIVKDGRIVYLSGYGTQVKGNEILGGNACTNYRIASVAKLITATVAMQLVEEGKMSLDDDIRKYVPQYDKGVKITIAQLLSHKAGLDTLTHYNANYFSTNNFFNPDDAISYFKNKPLIPGYPKSGDKDFGYYSNIGFTLVAAAIEKAGEAPYSQQVYERIGKPLNLPFLTPEFKWGEPYEVDMYNGDMTPAISHNGARLEYLPSGGYIASAIDLTLLAQAFVQGKIFADPNSLTEMSTLRSFIKNRNDMKYGYGITRTNYSVNGKNHIILGHSGGMVGGGASLFFIKDDDFEIGVALLTNTTNVTLDTEAKEILKRIPLMSVKSTTDFVPNDPELSHQVYYHGSEPTYYGEKVIRNGKIAESFNELSIVGNEVELQPGFEVTTSTEFEVRLANQNFECPNNSKPSLMMNSKLNTEVGQSDNQGLMEDISVFPNPARESIKITLKQPENSKIEIFSHDGAKIYASEKLDYINDVDISSVDDGLYIISLTKRDGSKEYLKFIKK